MATLINLPEDSHAYSTALEVSAGGKLYNVVVEDETVGTQLLKKGNLKKRVTIIPLNKINAFRVSAEVGSSVQFPFRHKLINRVPPRNSQLPPRWPLIRRILPYPWSAMPTM